MHCMQNTDRYLTWIQLDRVFNTTQKQYTLPIKPTHLNSKEYKIHSIITFASSFHLRIDVSKSSPLNGKCSLFPFGTMLFGRVPPRMEERRDPWFQSYRSCSCFQTQHGASIHFFSSTSKKGLQPKNKKALKGPIRKKNQIKNSHEFCM